MHIWSENFELIGSLTTIVDTNWNLQLDIEGLKKRKREKALEMFEIANNITYESLFEGNIKLYPIDNK